MSKSIDREEAKARLSRIGKTQTELAHELNVDWSTVQGVLSGRLQGTRGDAHKVAVALGMKDGVIVEANTSISEAIKALAA